MEVADIVAGVEEVVAEVPTDEQVKVEVA